MYVERKIVYSLAKELCEMYGSDLDDAAKRVMGEYIFEFVAELPAADVVPRADLLACRNELCLKCGRYQEAHKGSCEGCRWQMEATEEEE